MLKRVLKSPKRAAAKAAKSGVRTPGNGRKDVAAKAARSSAPRSGKSH